MLDFYNDQLTSMSISNYTFKIISLSLWSSKQNYVSERKGYLIKNRSVYRLVQFELKGLLDPNQPKGIGLGQFRLGDFHPLNLNQNHPEAK